MDGGSGFPTADWLTKANADYMARVIDNYWRQRGYRIDITVEMVNKDSVDRHVAWQIRSDMVNGLPRGYNGRGLDGGECSKL